MPFAWESLRRVQALQAILPRFTPTRAAPAVPAVAQPTPRPAPSRPSGVPLGRPIYTNSRSPAPAAVMLARPVHEDQDDQDPIILSARMMRISSLDFGILANWYSPLLQIAPHKQDDARMKALSCLFPNGWQDDDQEDGCHYIISHGPDAKIIRNCTCNLV